jgi:hypothetical protein
MRAALVAALLVTAAGVLYGVPATPRTGPPTAASGPASPAPTGTTTSPARSAAAPSAVRDDSPQGGSPQDGHPPDPRPDGRLPIPPGAVGVPVHLADPAALVVLRPGDRVDLLAVADEPRPDTIATAVLVLAVPALADVPDSGIVLLALSPDQARHAVRLPPHVRLAVVVRA